MVRVYPSTRCVTLPPTTPSTSFPAHLQALEDKEALAGGSSTDYNNFDSVPWKEVLDQLKTAVFDGMKQVWYSGMRCRMRGVMRHDGLRAHRLAASPTTHVARVDPCARRQRIETKLSQLKSELRRSRLMRFATR